MTPQQFEERARFLRTWNLWATAIVVVLLPAGATFLTVEEHDARVGAGHLPKELF